jgi:uncharacterized heparinase superfamily protein
MRKDKILWLANRFASMSAAELVYRIRQAAFRQVAKRGFKSYTPVNSVLLPILPGFSEGMEKLKGNKAFEVLLCKKVKLIKSTPFSAHGKTWPADTAEHRWHRDPESGGLWPKDVFCFSIESRHRSELGDPKFVWELNKLQHLQWVAAHFAVTSDNTSAEYCVNEVESWLRANPPFFGINWASGVECASRILSLGIICSLITPEHWKPETLRLLNNSLSAHGFWLAKNLSLHSSANNHLIVELAGMFVLGHMCPYLPQTKTWRDQAEISLERETLLQFAPDGGNREQSPTYGAWSLEWLCLCAKIAINKNATLKPTTLDRLIKAAEALETICDRNGNFPRIGDDDDATALAFDGPRKDWMHSVIGLAKSLSNKNEVNAPPQLLSAFGWASPAKPHRQAMTLLPDTGLSVFRLQQMKQETMVVFDHGSLGYLSIAAHGHADALSIWLHRAGQPIFVDSGTYCYGADPVARNYFRSTKAHNTLTIADRDSSIMTGPFNWSKRAKAAFEKFDEKNWSVTASHDGFAPSIHQRQITLSEQALAVVDNLSNIQSSQIINIRFHLHPDLEAHKTITGYDVSRNGQLILKAQTEGPLSWVIGENQSAPKSGLHSDHMGVRVQTQLLHLTGIIEGKLSQATTFTFV